MVEGKHRLASAESFESRPLRLASVDGILLWPPVARSHEGDAELPERIFEALDGADLLDAKGEWHVEIFSVVADRAIAWIQLRLIGDTEHTLTLKLGRRNAAAGAVSVLAAWIASRLESPHIVSVC